MDATLLGLLQAKWEEPLDEDLLPIIADRLADLEDHREALLRDPVILRASYNCQTRNPQHLPVAISPGPNSVEIHQDCVWWSGVKLNIESRYSCHESLCTVVEFYGTSEDEAFYQHLAGQSTSWCPSEVARFPGGLGIRLAGEHIVQVRLPVEFRIDIGGFEEARQFVLEATLYSPSLAWRKWLCETFPEAVGPAGWNAEIFK